MPKKRQYSTIQIETTIKNGIVDHCEMNGMKIGRFVEKLFLDFVDSVSGTMKMQQL